MSALDEEIRKAAGALAAAPRVPANWLMMFLLLVRKRDAASLSSLIMARARQNGDPLSFLYYGLRELVSAHADADAETAWLADYFAQNAALAALADRARAGLALRQGAWLEALSASRRAAAGLSAAPEQRNPAQAGFAAQLDAGPGRHVQRRTAQRARPFCTIRDLSAHLPGHVGGLVELPEHPDKMATRLANT